MQSSPQMTVTSASCGTGDHPIPALIGRCDTTERFQRRFHAPLLSIAPVGDPTGSQRVRSSFACLPYSYQTQSAESVNKLSNQNTWLSTSPAN